MRFAPLLVLLSLGLLACSDDATTTSPGTTGGKAGASGSSPSGGQAGQAGAAGKVPGGGGGTTSAGQGGGSGAAGLGGSGAAGQAGGGPAGQAGQTGQAGQGGSGGSAAGMSGSSGQAGMAGAGGGCGACDQPGQVCVGGTCVSDCRQPGAKPCGAGQVCDVGSEHKGQCVAPDEGCVITSAPTTCGASGAVCGPGTTCGLASKCVPSLPCQTMVCVSGTCWGESCACARPAPTCQVATLGAPGEVGTLNDPGFLRGGTSPKEGAIDLDFDPQCNAWAVTIISGTDYLRKMTPAGMLSTINGVTNLNMGEVAVLTGKEGGFSGGDGDVALTYICCESCGCILSGSGGNPQGAAIFDGETNTLPMKIPTTKFTKGAGPFGNMALDTGPYGLTWGLDRVLYLGNVEKNGDFQALDVLSGTTAPVAMFEQRVHAAAPYDAEHMMVALEGGSVMLVPVLGLSGQPGLMITLPTHVTSLVRDPWSGRIYAELADLSIVSFGPYDSTLIPFATAPARGRIALAPDGYLYHLSVYPAPPEVVRFALPTTL